ncbi:hypothetical protein PFLUV_G00093890 [Perca fluviatilis]|uniref:Uncharacterized protein n=1 Tax=Perca fluviatilis TaxID=8168 RepID=A0A6A5FA81_PERFL|nr:hypothetical protein PFLUV_G00093890 [Perca fluviatilis]
MERQNGSSSICSRAHGTVTEGQKKKTKKEEEEKEKIPDRVTLKKEIGLLSACTIIIDESEFVSAQSPQAAWQKNIVCWSRTDSRELLNTPEESKYRGIMQDGWMEEGMDGWMDGGMDGGGPAGGQET